MDLRLQKVCVKFGEWELKNISFEVNSSEFFSIVGPTGSGKSTILKAIAGIEGIKSGSVFVSDKKINDVAPEKRNIGFVFQNASLFSHLNVLENVAFGPKIRKDKNASEKAKMFLEMVGLNGFEERKVSGLSGGQSRLVSIARALAIEPKILLLDEPLNGLDARLREKLKVLIKKIQRELKVTTVYVTHDIDEAFFLSDKIMVLNEGKVEQIGLPSEIFSSPKNSFVREFVSDYALVKANVEKKHNKNFLVGEFAFETDLNEGKGYINIKKNNFRK